MSMFEPLEPVPPVSPAPVPNSAPAKNGAAPVDGGEAPAAAPVSRRARVTRASRAANQADGATQPDNSNAQGKSEATRGEGKATINGKTTGNGNAAGNGEATGHARPFDETEMLLWRTPSARFNHDEFDHIFALWKQNSDPRLRERLILMHRNLVTFLARRFVERGELLEDVMQVGMLGLIYAIDSFDPSRGLKFSTYAIPTIAGEIRRYFRDKVSGMRVPRRLHELYASLQGQIEALTQQLDRSPTYAEIASSLQLEVEEVVEALELGAVLDPNSLDSFAFGDDEEGTTLADQVGALDPHIAAIEEYSTLQAALEQLEPKKREVLELTYFEGYSQADVARRLNVSQMHISRLLRRSLADLRALLDAV